jgi:hypothetical protein
MSVILVVEYWGARFGVLMAATEDSRHVGCDADPSGGT